MKKMIPDCYWPSSANGSYVSHEAVCVLNTGTEPATIKLTLYFEDSEKIDGYEVVVPGERTKHIRMDQIVSKDGKTVPKDTPYAMVVESDRDVTVQYTRVDTTQAELSISTTMV